VVRTASEKPAYGRIKEVLHRGGLEIWGARHTAKKKKGKIRETLNRHSTILKGLGEIKAQSENTTKRGKRGGKKR